MSLTPMTRSQMIRIINNIAKVIKTGNIELLTRTSYDFLYLAQGFIAHYDIHGFKAYYEDTAKLKQDILDNHMANQWRNFHSKDKDFEYYFAKRLCYDGIVNAIDPDEWPKHRDPIPECGECA